jgi:eukaryotic-like serine/threonine-protein kinase
MSNPEQFGKYLLLEKIAAGGMAEIYLARSGAANGLNKFFAIKRILPQYSTNEDFVSMFKEEAKVAINLNHGNVVSIYDFGIEASQFYLVMDYVEGRNLRQIINELKKTNKSFTIDQALYLVKETAAGLDHAHRYTDSTSGRPLNITHRDMSPQNIMVSFEGEVKVIDFGISKADTEAEDTKAGTLKGKFSYMSPEQAEGQPIDPRTDVFALGIVLWELLANDRLFTGSNEAAILRKVRDCQVPPIRKINPTVPQELERIVMKSLAKDRNVRYQTAANFHRDLNRFLNTQYPDFSTQDFSQFIKESFKTAFQDGRDKLVGYSQLKVAPQPLPLDLKPISVPPIPVPSAPAEKFENKVVENKNEIPQPLIPNGFSTEQNLKINLDGLRSSTSNNKTSIGNNYNKPQSVSHNQTRITQVTHMRYNQNESSSMQVVFKLILVAALGAGGWWGYKTYPNEIKRQIAVFTGKVKLETNQPTIASVPVEVKVSISSSPDSAEIYINGKDTGNKTPAVVTMTANKPAEIMIKKEGYLEYRVSRVFNETSQVTATMQATVLPAYLNIKLADTNTFTKIYINGKELLEKPPILNYPIVAQKETSISAYNPITKQTDEIKITAKPGESMNVELNLDKNHKIKK